MLNKEKYVVPSYFRLTPDFRYSIVISLSLSYNVITVRYLQVYLLAAECGRKLLPLPLANLDIISNTVEYSLGMSNEIRHLFVTLKRSFAGTRETHINIVRSLGLRKREQTVQKANVASVRGAIDKVRLCRPYEAYVNFEGLHLSQTIPPAGETLSHRRDRPGTSGKIKLGGSQSCSPSTYHNKPLGVTLTTTGCTQDLARGLV